MQPMNIILVAIGIGLMVTSVVKGAASPDTGQPCTVNDRLLAIVADQDKKITDMMVEAKKEADITRKKYEGLITELEEKGCKKQ
jgi:hypothetical protein